MNSKKHSNLIKRLLIETNINAVVGNRYRDPFIAILHNNNNQLLLEELASIEYGFLCQLEQSIIFDDEIMAFLLIDKIFQITSPLCNVCNIFAIFSYL